MISRYLILGLITIGIFNFSCKKKTVDIHENLIVEGNTPPPYDGISSTQIEVYVNKLHIDLLGVQVNDSDLASYTQYLKQQNLSTASRDSVIDVILSKQQYYDRLFALLSGRMLEGINEFQLQDEVNTYTFVAQQLYATGDTLNAQVVEYERDKLAYLLDADSLYMEGDINVNQFYAAFSNNLVYDEINMGSLNFVIACFENFLYRSPTAQETTNGVEMVDGQSRPILQSDGNSKLDFIGIITTCNEFYEGLVIENFTSYLSRQPTSQEMFDFTDLVKTSNDLEELKKNILHTDEYAGF